MPTGPPIYGLKKLNMTIVQACGVSSTSYNTSIRLYVTGLHSSTLRHM